MVDAADNPVIKQSPCRVKYVSGKVNHLSSSSFDQLKDTLPNRGQ